MTRSRAGQWYAIGALGVGLLLIAGGLGYGQAENARLAAEQKTKLARRLDARQRGQRSAVEVCYHRVIIREAEGEQVEARGETLEKAQAKAIALAKLALLKACEDQANAFQPALCADSCGLQDNAGILDAPKIDTVSNYNLECRHEPAEPLPFVCAAKPVGTCKYQRKCGSRAKDPLRCGGWPKAYQCGPNDWSCNTVQNPPEGPPPRPGPGGTADSCRCQRGNLPANQWVCVQCGRFGQPCGPTKPCCYQDTDYDGQEDLTCNTPQLGLNGICGYE